MTDDSTLIDHATKAINPRLLSPHADAGSVASALVTDVGNIYVGVCIDTASSMGFCAEHNAIGSMITGGESRIATIVAVGSGGRILPPCGRCREFIFQVDNMNAETRVLMPGGRMMTIAELLPEQWGSYEERDDRAD
jgi:cytidine deaminase